MSNLIFNEGYKSSNLIFDKGVGSKIYLKKKSFIDLSNCAGSLLLGHNSKIFQNALKKYLKNKISIFAHPNIHAVNYSKNIKKIFPQFNKIIFCNSGSEAIIKSLRISRSINNKKYIVSVAGSWHGSVDKLLYHADKNFNPKKISDGLSEVDKQNLKFIPYNDIERSKKILSKIRKNINCLIIEPIQGCLPLQNARSYLKFLEKFCKKNSIILIFDEMITGVRVENGSVHRRYKIRPDITTIGKAVSGGLPNGIIGVSNKLSRLINKKKIFFGGTFSGNSLSSFVGNETLKYFSKNKFIIKNLNKKSEYFQKSLNLYLEKNKIDAKVYRFDSILRIVFSKNIVFNRSQRDFFEKKNLQKIKKFRSFLLNKKIYYPTSGIIFFSNATSYEEINFVLKNFKLGLNNIFNKKIK